MNPGAPTVSFVVPCYNLAHLLAECVESILGQTYGDLEVLIMDDASPDNTPEVARSFRDRRVKHVRNEVNLKHLANYNRGIGLARGRYIWLVSADDKLRRPYVLERFVELMEARPEAGFVFCPVMKFRDGKDLMLYGSCGDADAVLDGRGFLVDHLLHGNIVPAPAGMARREAYDRAGLFPLDMPFAGDWYMWAAFALDAAVGYFAEPMVAYRYHDLNMTNSFKEKSRLLMADEMRVLWRLHALVESRGDGKLASAVKLAIARHYSYRLTNRIRDPDAIGMTPADLEESLETWCADRRTRSFIRARAHSALADRLSDAGEIGLARRSYEIALREAPLRPGTAAKYALLRCGRPGRAMRDCLAAVRRRLDGGARGTPVS